jgi:oxygen-independent coproporphyrinogen-3 oxidase
MRSNESCTESCVAVAASPTENAPSLYVHLPFCTIRCPYCDFATLPHEAGAEARYLEALRHELTLLGVHESAAPSLFLGGGTPNALSERGLERLFEILAPFFGCRPAAEVTVEANPSLLTPAQARKLAQLGVTRVSLGAQSFDSAQLAFLGRDHDARDIERSVANLRDAGIGEINLDLIFGLPGQTLAGWRADLEAAVALGTEHISTYELTYEQGTPLYRQWLGGTVRKTTDDIAARLYLLARRLLSDAGLLQYEISNFARAGHRSHHNMRYWRNENCLGIGISAASYLQGRRRVNHRALGRYHECLRRGELPTASDETLERRAAARETVIVGLRMLDGIPESRLRARFGLGFDDLYGAQLTTLVKKGLLILEQDVLRLSEQALPLADSVLVELV